MSPLFRISMEQTGLQEIRMLARGGGGGSSSSGGGGGGGSFSSSSSSSSGSSGSSVASSRPLTPGEWVIVLVLVFGVLLIGVMITRYTWKLEMRRRKLLKDALSASAEKDPLWVESELTKRVSEVFMSFQKAWSDIDAVAMKEILTESYYRRMVLELNVLINLKRKNLMEEVRLMSVVLQNATDDANDQNDSFTAQVRAWAVDKIVNTESGKVLHSETSGFLEYWTFKRESGVWKLALIEQSTESQSMKEKPLSDFSARNGFYYDPDFGWLMMPDKGYLFRAANFGKSDINNHVIGYFREKIIEFYTYRPVVDDKGNSKENYVIAQAILPISHHDILIRKRKMLFNTTPSGMSEISLEWGDFNKKFFVCADLRDNVTSLELLNPKFMEKIHDLPFELNIEVVGNVLYLYTLDRSASYDQMLEVLSWAFDEMKM